jgi:hypothetical protein
LRSGGTGEESAFGGGEVPVVVVEQEKEETKY